MDSPHVESRIDPEVYRLAAREELGDWSTSDRQWLKGFLHDARGKRLMKWLTLREQEAMLAIGANNLDNEDGINRARKAQGRASGWISAINEIIDLAQEVEASPAQETEI